MAKDLNTDASGADNAAQDAALRALFAGSDRPPMADEQFTGAVMAAVTADASHRKHVRFAVAAGGISICAALLAPHLGTGAADVLAVFNDATAGVPVLGTNTVTLMVVGLATAAGWAVAERA